MVKRFFLFFTTKIGFALLIAFILIGGSIIYVYGPRFTKSSETKDSSVVAVELIKKSLDADSDGDGLKDWEETLYKTDPHNPDTDGDGMNDNDEIKANRDPLVPGAGEGPKISDPTASSTISDNTTATDRFSRELFQKYLEAKSSGKDITEELSNSIADAVLSEQYQPYIEAYDVSKLDLVPETAQNIHTYGNTLGKIFSTPPVDGTVNELIILDRIQGGTATADDAVILGKIIARYNGMLEKLENMSVPSSAASIHAEFIQGIEIMRDVSVGISTLETDPIGAYTKIARYEDGLNTLTSTSIKVRSYLMSHNVIYSTQESGYLLVQ